jgi:hypothetical protein
MEAEVSAIVWITNTLFTPILISVIGIIVGLFIFFKPKLTIEIQKRFYARINWRLEPVSMQKEIRNTKIMGMFLAVVAAVAIIYSLINTV